jgi:hypothetical protein
MNAMHVLPSERSPSGLLPHFLRRATFACAMIVAGGILMAGCAKPDLMGPGFKGPAADWGQNLRPRPKPRGGGQQFGLSSKSREIERDLGVE